MFWSGQRMCLKILEARYLYELCLEIQFLHRSKHTACRLQRPIV